MKVFALLIVLMSVACATTSSQQVKVKPICMKNWNYCLSSYYEPDQKLAFCNGRGNVHCAYSDWVALCKSDMQVCQSNF